MRCSFSAKELAYIENHYRHALGEKPTEYELKLLKKLVKYTDRAYHSSKESANK